MYPYVGIIQIRLWVEVKNFLSAYSYAPLFIYSFTITRPDEICQVLRTWLVYKKRITFVHGSLF